MYKILLSVVLTSALIVGFTGCGSSKKNINPLTPPKSMTNEQLKVDLSNITDTQNTQEYRDIILEEGLKKAYYSRDNRLNGHYLLVSGKCLYRDYLNHCYKLLDNGLINVSSNFNTSRNAVITQGEIDVINTVQTNLSLHVNNVNKNCVKYRKYFKKNFTTIVNYPKKLLSEASIKEVKRLNPLTFKPNYCRLIGVPINKNEKIGNKILRLNNSIDFDKELNIIKVNSVRFNYIKGFKIKSNQYPINISINESGIIHLVNNSNSTIKIGSISLYYGEDIFTSQSKLLLPPNSETDFHSLERDRYYFEKEILNTNASMNVGIALTYQQKRQIKDIYEVRKVNYKK